MMPACTCPSCVRACHNQPGWFTPRQIVSAARAKGLTAEAFVRRFLVVDYWLNKGEQPPTFSLRPAKAGERAGTVARFNPVPGPCRFLVADRCSIHATKPRECVIVHHALPREQYLREKDTIVAAWARHQPFLRRLLGRTPKEPRATWSDRLSLMGYGGGWGGIF